VVNNPDLWEALKEHLNNLQTLELQVLVAATLEQEMYRSQGKIRSLAHLGSLKEQVKEAIGRSD
jgi:hypothetical protein